eukprot:5019220-Amphidinium_carterae.1
MGEFQERPTGLQQSQHSGAAVIVKKAAEDLEKELEGQNREAEVTKLRLAYDQALMDEEALSSALAPSREINVLEARMQQGKAEKEGGVPTPPS